MKLLRRRGLPLTPRLLPLATARTSPLNSSTPTATTAAATTPTAVTTATPTPSGATTTATEAPTPATTPSAATTSATSNAPIAYTTTTTPATTATTLATLALADAALPTKSRSSPIILSTKDIEPSGENADCVDRDTYAPLATFTAEPGSGLYTLHTGLRWQQQQQHQHQQQLLPPTPLTIPRQVPASYQVAAFPQVAVFGQVPVSGPVAASCSYRSLARPTVLWHHWMGHPSIFCLRAMSSQRLVLGLPRVMPSLPPSLAPPCGPCVEGRLRATPHSSLGPATEPFETLHLDIWGPASRPGPE
ncbi:unnamed protein product [Closterium sp. NIES-54]